MPKSEQERRELAEMISRLLSHYWTPDDDPAIRRAQMRDWIEDLSEFPLALVAEACRDWRRQPGGRRPTPGDIYQLCAAEQTRLRRHQDVIREATSYLPPPDPPRATEAEKAYVDAVMRRWRERGEMGGRSRPSHYGR